MVLVYLIVLFLKTKGPIAIAKIVFFNKQTNICWFKYKSGGFYDFTLSLFNIIYTENKWKKCFFPWNETFLYSKNGS